MKVITVQGSPRKKGNTARMLEWVQDELRRSGHAVEHVHAGDGHFKPCVECQTCKKYPDRPGCVFQDGGNEFFESLIRADLVVFASPIFCWGVTAQLKALIDRAYCLLKIDEGGAYRILKVAGKPGGTRFALLATGGGDVSGNLDLLVPPFNALAEFTGCVNKGVLLQPFCTDPESLGDEAERKAREFARQIAAE